MKLDVFVDWIERPDLDRSNVSPENAEAMRDVMGRCSTLLYALSANSSQSKWMPWELGYSDAKHGRIAILPITETATTTSVFSGQEFLGLYPYINIDTKANDDSGDRYLWVHDPTSWNKYAIFHSWRGNGQLYDHP
jgi:hypothetical protein